MELFQIVELGQQRRPKPGDLFSYKMRGRWGFCRVIRNDIRLMASSCLTYFFKGQSSDIEHVPDISINNLLFPPVILIKDTWNHRIFRFVCNRPITDNQIIQSHYFWHPIHRVYKNEDGEIIHPPNKPAFESIYALNGLQTIEVMLGKAHHYINSISDLKMLPELDSPSSTNQDANIHLIISIDSLDGATLNKIELEFDSLKTSGNIGTLIECLANNSERIYVFELSNSRLNLFLEQLGVLLPTLGVDKWQIVDGVSGLPLV